jgi:hypothetical protein
MKITKKDFCTIYDDILSIEEQEAIKEIILSKKIKFMICDYSVGPELQESNSNENCKEHPQLSAMIVENNVACNTYANEISQILKKFLDSIGARCRDVLRIKLNIQEKALDYNDNYHLTPHVDLDLMHNVLLYYPFDSDGDTLLFTRDNDQWKIVESVTPKQGRFLLFSGDQYHAGRPPVVSEARFVINIDFR